MRPEGRVVHELQHGMLGYFELFATRSHTALRQIAPWIGEKAKLAEIIIISE